MPRALSGPTHERENPPQRFYNARNRVSGRRAERETGLHAGRSPPGYSRNRGELQALSNSLQLASW
jgi:hypothetical protein